MASPTLSNRRLNAISSMATRAVLANLAVHYQARHGAVLVVESMGGDACLPGSMPR